MIDTKITDWLYEKYLNAKFTEFDPNDLSYVPWNHEQYGSTRILGVQAILVHFDPREGLHLNPLKVEGFLEIENPVKDRKILFTFFHNQLSINLQEFPLTKPQIEIIKHRLIGICQICFINIGAYKVCMSKLKWIVSLWAVLIGGVIGGAWWGEFIKRLIVTFR